MGNRGSGTKPPRTEVSIPIINQVLHLGVAHIREWSLFAARGAVEFQISLALKPCPPQQWRTTHFPPSEPVHWNLAPPSCRVHIYLCLLRHMVIQQLTYHAKYVMNMGSCWELIYWCCVRKILAMVFSRSDMALRCLCTEIIPPPHEAVHWNFVPPPPTSCTQILCPPYSTVPPCRK